MLTLTNNAVDAIRNLTVEQAVPDEGGLRIADDGAGALTISLVPAPYDGDQVLDASGARLFLDPGASQVLDDKELDAATGHDGRVRFAVAEQEV
jgi:iron-sulfur cluster assembly protein